jgi:hypothetical protein
VIRSKGENKSFPTLGSLKHGAVSTVVRTSLASPRRLCFLRWALACHHLTMATTTRRNPTRIIRQQWKATKKHRERGRVLMSVVHILPRQWQQPRGNMRAIRRFSPTIAAPPLRPLYIPQYSRNPPARASTRTVLEVDSDATCNFNKEQHRCLAPTALQGPFKCSTLSRFSQQFWRAIRHLVTQ